MDLNTFIAVAEDCKAATGTVPKRRSDNPTVAEIQYRMLVDEAYQHTQEDVMLASSKESRDNPNDSAKAREIFFSKSQTCLRTSPLVKTYGWGIHFDDKGHAAAVPVGSKEYRELAAREDLTQTRAMRSKRA